MWLEFKWAGVVIFIREGVVLWFVCIGGEVALGALFHELENLTLYGFVLGFMGWMSMCILSVIFRTFCNSCGGCIFIGSCVGLCTQIIDVSNGSMYW